MHPLLAKGRIILYLLVWAAMGGLLGYMLTITGRLAWQEAGLLALPLALFYAFVCLAPWYMCRVLPLGEGRLPKLVGNHLAAAIAAALFWIVVAKVLGLGLSRYYPASMNVSAPSFRCCLASACCCTCFRLRCITCCCRSNLPRNPNRESTKPARSLAKPKSKR